MRRRRLPTSAVRTAILALCLLGAGALGLVLARSHPAAHTELREAVRLRAGVPLGVLDTRAGALAAADNYVALASQSVEQDPALFARLVGLAFAASARADALREAASLRAADPADMANYRAGGRGLAIVAARRLDSYTPARAQVTSWLGGFVWGPDVQPRQSWNLVNTTLKWHAGRWMIASSQTEPTPAPVPSIVYVEAHNNQASAFARLAGMSAPYYGTGG